MHDINWALLKAQTFPRWIICEGSNSGPRDQTTPSYWGLSPRDNFHFQSTFPTSLVENWINKENSSPLTISMFSQQAKCCCYLGSSQQVWSSGASPPSRCPPTWPDDGQQQAGFSTIWGYHKKYIHPTAHIRALPAVCWMNYELPRGQLGH